MAGTERCSCVVAGMKSFAVVDERSLDNSYSVVAVEVVGGIVTDKLAVQSYSSLVVLAVLERIASRQGRLETPTFSSLDDSRVLVALLEEQFLLSCWFLLDHARQH